MIRVLLLTFAIALHPAGNLAAQDTPPDEQAETASQAPSEERDGEAVEVEGSADAGEDSPAADAHEYGLANPCEVEADADEPRLDQFRREVFESVCESAAWFDGFFGNLRFDEEARRTHGRVGGQVVYDEHEGWELDGILKVRVDFPNVDNRINAFLDRDDQEGFITGTEDDLAFLPSFFQQERERQWLLGLGYRPVSGDRSSLDFDVGVEIETPLDPFVSARYRYFWLVGNDSLVRARQTIYWTNQRDLGSGTRIDYERPFGSSTLARWATNFVIDSLADGVDWDSGVTLYHGFSNQRALAWFVGVDGETGRDVPIENYGTRITYRQRMLRDWFFGELITGVTWPRDNLEQERELAWQVGFGFEIQFSGEDLGIGANGADRRSDE